MPKDIVQKGNTVLRQKAEPISVSDISTPRVQKILQEMRESLETQVDGVALAAPQIGYSLRIFVASPKAYLKSKDNDTPAHQPLIFINPRIIKMSRKKAWMDEGCLSVRPWYGKTRRSVKATVEAYDENGQKFTYGGSGLLAQIFQHETDHLDGILFSDHAKELREYSPEEIRESQ